MAHENDAYQWCCTAVPQLTGWLEVSRVNPLALWPCPEANVSLQMNIRGSFLRLDTDVSDNSSGSPFVPSGPTARALPCEHIQRHRDERGRAPGLLPAGPSAFSEVPGSIYLARGPVVSCSFKRVCEHGPHRRPCRGGAQGRCTKRQSRESDRCWMQ